jgi:Co/Zn/Cd efflux system component
MSFGWKRAEIVGALANGCFLLAVVFTIALEAVERLCGLAPVNPEQLSGGAITIIITGAIGLAINLFGMCIFGGHSHGRLLVVMKPVLMCSRLFLLVFFVRMHAAPRANASPALIIQRHAARVDI